MISLLRSNLTRRLQRVRNVFAATSRAGRLRATRMLLVASALCAAYLWIVAWLVSPAPADPRSFRLDTLTASALAHVVGLMLLLDAVHRVRSSERQGDRLAFERLMIVAGIGATARAMLALTELVGRALVWGIVPVFALATASRDLSGAQRLAFVAIGATYTLGGDAIGRLTSKSRTLRMLVWVSVAAWYVVSVAAILTGVAPDLVGIADWSRQIGAWPWPFLLGGPAWSRTLPIFAVAVVVAFLARLRWTATLGWSAEGARRPDRASRVASRGASVRKSTRERSVGRVLAMRDLARFSNWIRREPLALLFLVALTAWPFAVLLLQSDRLPLAFRVASLPWTAAYCMSFASLALVEVVWSAERQHEWAWLRVATGRLASVVAARLTVLVSLVAALAFVASVPLVAHAFARRGAPAFLLLSLLCGVTGVTAGSVVATLVLRLGGASPGFGRLCRYAGVMVGLLVPNVLIATTASTGVSAAVTVVVVAFACAIAVSQVGRVEFAGPHEDD